MRELNYKEAKQLQFLGKALKLDLCIMNSTTGFKLEVCEK